MTAYEFKASVNDGVIYIPAEYRNKISKRVKVILLSEEIDEQINVKKDMFTAMSLDTRDFIFNREEVNER